MNQMNHEGFQRAVDSSMIIALAKFLLFNKCWEILRAQLKRVGSKDEENIRIVLRERVNNLPNDLFFIPPEEAVSEKAVKRYFQSKFEGNGLQRIMEELISRTRSSDPELSSYLEQARKL